MTPKTIQDARIQPLNGRDVKKGKYVLYWMQQSQRAEDNHALEYAVARANDLGQPVLVTFGLCYDYPEANLRHYAFMLEGLRETQSALARRGIKMVIRPGSPPDVAMALGRRASLIVCDRGYLRHQKAWRIIVARTAECGVVQVESDVIIPVEVVSQKAEYAARTIRPRIYKYLNDYLLSFKSAVLKNPSLGLKIHGLDLKDISSVLEKFPVDRGVGPVPQFFKGGSSHGKAKLKGFIQKKFHGYVENRNQPQTDYVSQVSPYLHFGQLSPLYVALQIMTARGGSGDARETYLEELIVRRELSMNFVTFTPTYDSFTCLPRWARETLQAHRHDPRQYTYTRAQLENAATHDEYWNAAMREMKITGFMHNYMRMYWGKKILEWSNTPEYAFRTALALNNKYFLDGRDPNSYAGVGWVFGLHDRAWSERPVFGKIRYMSAAGLERKCDIRGYVEKVNSYDGR